MTFTAKCRQDQRKTAPSSYPGGTRERLTRTILDHHVNTRLTPNMLQGSFGVHYDRNASELGHTGPELGSNVVYACCTETYTLISTSIAPTIALEKYKFRQ